MYIFVLIFVIALRIRHITIFCITRRKRERAERERQALERQKEMEKQRQEELRRQQEHVRLQNCTI